MSRYFSAFAQVLAALPLAAAGFFTVSTASSADAQALPRIKAPVESSSLVAIPGEVHPWARAEFDRGPAPANLNGHLLLVLKRSPQQETALHSLLASQQDPKSPNYHKWLTPQEFGKRFGVADSDVQTVTGYLSGQGMRVGRVYDNRLAIEVGATAAQIRSAFHTEIHTYSVAGKTYYANSTNPQIPSALRGVVAGFASMNNFHIAGGSGAGAQATYNPATHTLKPLYTITATNPDTYGVSPADLAAIYGIPASTSTQGGLGGKNVNVGIVGDSDINVSYVNNYRSIFGLGANTPIVVVDGNDPGVNGDAYIAYKQIELVGAVAPNANIYYYNSATTDYDSGIYFALERAVSDNQVQVLLNGFQECETAIGDGGMELVNMVAEQAAAQGMTFVAAAGNTGSAGCEVQGTTGTATSGYAVNGFATSPYLTAVGGTDFYYGTLTPPSLYWSIINLGYWSALSYIPEQAWNDSYPNYTNLVTGTSAPSVKLAGGGGISTAGLDGISTPQPIPSWQLSNANAKAISSTSRIIPDVSFFAGSGANDTEGYNSAAYMFCMQSADCQTGGTPQFSYSGGTEASSAVFAGAVALAVEQYNAGSRFGLGNVNPTLYSIFNTITSHDITRGNNELSCNSGTPNCALNGSNYVMTGYAAGTGYDAATGLGSFNILSFVTNYKPANTTPSSVALTVTDANGLALPACTVNGVSSHCTTHSAWMKFKVATTPSAATGDVAIFASTPLQSEAAVDTLTLSGGTASDTWNLLPGGTYNLYARYAGNSTYAPSITGTPYNISVQPESCQMVVYGHNVNVGTTTSVPYGTPVYITVEPYSAATTNNVGIPSGSINVTDGGTLITTLPVNSEGATTFSSNLLAFGSHSIMLTYPGDASFNACSTGNFPVQVVSASTRTSLNAPDTELYSTTGGIAVTAVVKSSTTPSNGTAPAGTVTFHTATPKTFTVVPGFDTNGNAIATASTTISVAELPADGLIYATFTPTNSNYLGSTSTSVAFTSRPPKNNDTPSSTTFTITDNNGTYNTGGSLSFPAQDSLTLNIKVTGNTPSNSYVLIYANGILLCTPAGIVPSNNGTVSFTIPQINGFVGLPSGLVQLSVVYAGWTHSNDGSNGVVQSEPSSANAQITIVDDRTGADFSLQSDTTVNQAAPLVSPTTTASYNLRLTSLYNFQSAYGSTAITLSCKVVGYSLAGVRSTPAGLGCGFNSTLTATTASVTLGGTGYASQALYVGATTGYAVAANSTPAQPAGRWWLAAGGGTTLACIFLFGLPARRRKWQSLLAACVLLAAGFGITGCGATLATKDPGYGTLTGGSTSGQAGSGTPVPAGTYTVMVTATTTANTTITHTLPVQVLVGANN
ncbi:MAG TPA: protease pro-enzyme activation domain-containing protein [Acidobacteriaceae bacterium]